MQLRWGVSLTPSRKSAPVLCYTSTSSSSLFYEYYHHQGTSVITNNEVNLYQNWWPLLLLWNFLYSPQLNHCWSHSVVSNFQNWQYSEILALQPLLYNNNWTQQTNFDISQNEQQCPQQFCEYGIWSLGLGFDRVQDSHEEQELWMTRLDWVGIRIN